MPPKKVHPFVDPFGFLGLDYNASQPAIIERVEEYEAKYAPEVYRGNKFKANPIIPGSFMPLIRLCPLIRIPHESAM